MDTIFAVATASGRAGVSVIRVSGPSAYDGLAPYLDGLDTTRRSPQLRALRNGDGDLIDTPMVLVFGDGKSFTGEPTVELQLHGSPAIVRAALTVLDSIASFRMAEPGEFTRRALINGKMTLDEVEGLGDLIEAETEAQLLQARKLLDGHLRDKTIEWRASLIRASALIQATIDFADEDVPVDVTPEVKEIVSDLIGILNNEISGLDVSERIRSGFEIAILGRPNAGKSTLLNYLSKRDVAIVSDVEGTTRDVIEVQMDVFGYPVTFLDTAGIRKSDDLVEKIGIERAAQRAAGADLRIWLSSGENDNSEIEMMPDDLILIAQDDSGRFENGISGISGYGVEQALVRIRNVLDTRAASVGVATKDRHGVALREAVDFLEKAIFGLTEGLDVELIAEDLRLAGYALDTLIGVVDVEDVLDEVFSSFCLGK
ncbi:tRNA uridine-5-carboxymethylaminomethyl(34) synthesis GTPase MnmE [Nereida sp. MMG025]|uniref:tRNA uridine-5-carboxymethylaminomethyl(34) synthesis GTPase MnmE n=1 Tax=Nereida sp. MMG025 TaxID=2909981 RepID=UPI001EFFD313|nr:tRNA uridine-5-carboxymethylaminomethyl(34) synthesis GTPase MnmE [Nereida sp. MMG025]MCF6444623.1 tRNA uridine-5-carboxymethylaminomethyl(34) synthesis GTPase MnmE [Nereida sp. MMG025]